MKKPSLSFSQIVNMNVGFFGIQYSFGLQQSAINPIFNFLGANYEDLPILNLAGPVTGLLVQPIIGAISDKTWMPKLGRRRPFFLIGAILGSLCLFLFPFSPSLWFAVGLLWILDAANNIAMEPYRAFVGDSLPEKQQTLGYLMQSLFVGAGITVANFSLFIFQSWNASGQESAFCVAEQSNTIPMWVYYTFFTGAFFSLISMLWSVFKTKEYPPNEEEWQAIMAYKSKSIISVVKETLLDIYHAIKNMPLMLQRLSVVYLFQWYAMFVYWQFVTPMFKKILYNISSSDEKELQHIKTLCAKGDTITNDQLLLAQTIQNKTELALADTGLMNGTYNFITMIAALLLVPIAIKIGSKITYAIALMVTGVSLLLLPQFGHVLITTLHIEMWSMQIPIYSYLVFAIGIGFGWASIMGLPYAMVSNVIPTSQRGVYMGIINMMIVIPMLIETVSFGKIFTHVLNQDPVHAILFAGVLLLIAGLLVFRIPKNTKS